MPESVAQWKRLWKSEHFLGIERVRPVQPAADKSHSHPQANRPHRYFVQNILTYPAIRALRKHLVFHGTGRPYTSSIQVVMHIIHRTYNDNNYSN